MKDRLKEITNNFTTHIHSSTLMTGDNYHSGMVKLDAITYFLAKYKNRVRVWNKVANYMDLLNDKQDFIIEYNL